MSHFTPKEAEIKNCPVDPKGATAIVKCAGDQCMMWRWRPLQASDPGWQAAVKKIMDSKSMTHPKAAQYVNEHRAELGLPTEPTHGYCGLAGRPEA